MPYCWKSHVVAHIDMVYMERLQRAFKHQDGTVAQRNRVRLFLKNKVSASFLILIQFTLQFPASADLLSTCLIYSSRGLLRKYVEKVARYKNVV